MLHHFDKIRLPFPHVQNSQTVFEEYLTIQKDELVTPNGDLYAYYTVRTKPHAAMVIATTEEGKLVLNKEYRHPIQKHILSCPGGLIEEDESPLEGAKREFLEETGFTAKDFTLMAAAYPLPGILQQKIHYVRAVEAKRIREPSLDPSEIIETLEIGFEELLGLVKRGMEIDGVLATALFFMMSLGKEA